MTATLQSIEATARSKLGYKEGPPPNYNGNITIFWAELAPSLQKAPWCACYQRWVNIHAGGPDLPISNPYFCPNYVTYAKQHGLWDSSGHYQPADLIFFDWDGSGVAEHIGRVISDNSSFVTTIEGNTSPQGGYGSQSDGGGVYERDRPHGSSILGVLRYDKLLAHAAANGGQAPRNPVKGNPYAARAAPCRYGDHGYQVRFVQWAVGVPVDGSFGTQSLKAVSHFQAYHLLHVDGIVGPQTLGELRRVTH